MTLSQLHMLSCIAAFSLTLGRRKAISTCESAPSFLLTAHTEMAGGSWDSLCMNLSSGAGGHAAGKASPLTQPLTGAVVCKVPGPQLC